MIRLGYRRLAAWSALGVALTLAGSAGWAYRALHRPHAGWEGEYVDVVLQPGLGANPMLRRLGDAGVLRHPRLARFWLGWSGGAGRLHAGEYRFERALTPVELLERLQKGDVLLHPVTIPEGLNFEEVAQRFALAGLADRDELLRSFRNGELVRDLDPQAIDLEGYLFPDTYHFPRGESGARIAKAMVRQFQEVTGPRFSDQAAEVGLSLREAVILASLIEKETSVPEERSRISRVFHNRLARGMKLECDPTVRYALFRAGRDVEQLTYQDLRFESPWNTYVIDRLPAGPIASPGEWSLWAAVNPAEGDELYFVASPQGGHRFSRDLAGHLRAVAEWRRYVRSSR